MATKTKTKRTKTLPGMENVTIPEIDEAAAEYVERRNERMELTESEVSAHDNLLALMQEHKLASYEYDGMVVRVNSKAKVSVKKKKGENGDGEESEADDE